MDFVHLLRGCCKDKNNVFVSNFELWIDKDLLISNDKNVSNK